MLVLRHDVQHVGGPWNSNLQLAFAVTEGIQELSRVLVPESQKAFRLARIPINV